ncbi:hypothetical protein PMAYCL1PPCAC_31040, partial [Pristionchus mayeri]
MAITGSWLEVTEHSPVVIFPANPLSSHGHSRLTLPHVEIVNFVRASQVHSVCGSPVFMSPTRLFFFVQVITRPNGTWAVVDPTKAIELDLQSGKMKMVSIGRPPSWSHWNIDPQPVYVTWEQKNEHVLMLAQFDLTCRSWAYTFRVPPFNTLLDHGRTTVHVAGVSTILAAFILYVFRRVRPDIIDVAHQMYVEYRVKRMQSTVILDANNMMWREAKMHYHPEETVILRDGTLMEMGLTDENHVGE